MERNLAEHVNYLHPALPGATVTTGDDLLVADSGINDDTFNIVAAARFTPDTANARIAETVRALRRPAAVLLVGGARVDPAQPGCPAGRRRLPASEYETAMWAPLAAIPAAEPL